MHIFYISNISAGHGGSSETYLMCKYEYESVLNWIPPKET